MKLVLAVLVIMFIGGNSWADCSGLYTYNSPAGIGLLQLGQDGTTIDGSLQLISPSDDLPGFVTTSIDLIGTIHGDRLSLRMNLGLLGKSSMFSGSLSGNAISLNFPEPDGHLIKGEFRKSSATSWNNIVTAFESRMGNIAKLRSLNADYSIACTNYNRNQSEIATDLTELQSEFNNLTAGHSRESEAEAAVDKANWANEKAKSANEAASSHPDEATLAQATETQLQQTSESLYKEEETLWNVTDGIWNEIRNITTLSSSIVSDANNEIAYYAQAAKDRKQIVQMESALRKPSHLSKLPFMTQSQFDHWLDEINARLAGMYPKPQKFVQGQIGEVSVDSAAVRNYNPYSEGALHHNVEVLLTMKKG